MNDPPVSSQGTGSAVAAGTVPAHDCHIGLDYNLVAEVGHMAMVHRVAGRRTGTGTVVQSTVDQQVLEKGTAVASGYRTRTGCKEGLNRLNRARIVNLGVGHSRMTAVETKRIRSALMAQRESEKPTCWP